MNDAEEQFLWNRRISHFLWNTVSLWSIFGENLKFPPRKIPELGDNLYSAQVRYQYMTIVANQYWIDQYRWRTVVGATSPSDNIVWRRNTSNCHIYNGKASQVWVLLISIGHFSIVVRSRIAVSFERSRIANFTIAYAISVFTLLGANNVWTIDFVVRRRHHRSTRSFVDINAYWMHD